MAKVADDIRVKIVYNREVQITYIREGITFEELKDEVRTICNLSDVIEDSDPFTIKWIDEEGDPCRIASQHELDEALRLYELEQDTEITIHVFPNVPQAAGVPCEGEDRSIYRRGARRWGKQYRVNGHIFQGKRFNPRAFCAYCGDRIWGLGRQGFKCVQCRILVHKKCHKMLLPPCSTSPQERIAELQVQDDTDGDKPQSHLSGVKTLADLAKMSISLEEKSRNRKSAGNYGEFIHELMIGSDNPSVEHPPHKLSDFQLLKVIGRGSYAKVMMVEFKRTKRIYAMKVIKKNMFNEDEDIDWVQTEKHVFEKVTNCPFLVGLHSCFQTPSRLFFIIEFISGGDLLYHMQRMRRLPEGDARFYAAEISLALDFLHNEGIIYRDLKLDNVLLDRDGHVRLTDYGMCKEGIIRDGDQASTFCGTPNYIAPEILQGEPYRFSVDWWALGVLMYEMLAGRSPFDLASTSENPDQNTEDYLFQVILQKTIRIPRSLSVKAVSVLKGFLCKIPTDRLGCASGKDSFEDIKNHRFFQTIDWQMLEEKQIEPPFRPRLTSDRDLRYFPPEFTDLPACLTPDEEIELTESDQAEFEGFDYVNPLLMSSEDFV